jgi:hypothetical protein
MAHYAVIGLRGVPDVSEPTWLAVQVAVARRPGLDISDPFEALNNGVPLTTQESTRTAKADNTFSTSTRVRCSSRTRRHSPGTRRQRLSR